MTIENKFKEFEHEIKSEINEMKNLKYEEYHNVKTFMKYAAVQMLGLAASTGMHLKTEDEEELKSLLANDGDAEKIKQRFQPFYNYSINLDGINLPFFYKHNDQFVNIGKVGFSIDRNSYVDFQYSDNCKFAGFNVKISLRQMISINSSSMSDKMFGFSTKLLDLVKQLLDLSIKFDNDLKNKFENNMVYECISSPKLKELKKQNNDIVNEIPDFWKNIKKDTKFMRKKSEKSIFVNCNYIKIYDEIDFNMDNKKFKITQPDYAKDFISLTRTA